MDQRWQRANTDPAPPCPRCASPNTKFCYYNNYSLSQPRYFCKGCRRYWTKGGSLRNVPVGGGCRKSRRSRSSKSGSNGGPSGHHLSPSLDPSSDSGREPGGPEIDMAAVFANFLNHGPSNNNTDNTSSEEGSHDSLASSTSYGVDNDVLDQEFQAIEGLLVAPSDHDEHQLQQEDEIPGFSGIPDLASFDDIIEDVFWSDDQSNLTSLTWQPGSHELQEFDLPLLPVDHQSKISINQFSSDNWSYFDTTGFGA